MAVGPGKSDAPKIAIFQYDLGVGGVQRSLINMLQNIKRDTYKVDLYIVDTDSFYKTNIPDEVNVIKMRPLPTFTKLLPFKVVRLLFGARIKQEAVAKSYDVSIDFSGYQHITALGALSVDARRYYTWIHDDNHDRRKGDFAFLIAGLIQRAKYNYFDKAIAVSSGLEYSICKTTPFSSDDIIIINNYIDTAKIIRDSQESSDIRLDTAQYHLVSVGRLVYQKGIDIMLQMFAQVATRRSDIHLHIIGDGHEREKLERLTEQLKLLDRVTFYGAQSNPYKYMAQMDGFISTSRHEGQGINILEAKCLGLDIFIPQHLEKYSYKVKAPEDMADDIFRVTKKTQKSHDRLVSYNRAVLKGIDTVFRGEV